MNSSSQIEAKAREGADLDSPAVLVGPTRPDTANELSQATGAPSPRGSALIWDEFTKLIASFLRDARENLSENRNSFLSAKILVAGFLAQASIAFFISRSLAQMPQVFDAFSQAIPFAIALFCFAVSLLLDRTLTPDEMTKEQSVRNSRVLFPRFSLFAFRLRVSLARYRLLAAALAGAATLLFGVMLIYFYHSAVLQVETDDGLLSLLFPTPEPDWLSNWRVAIEAETPTAELVTFNLQELLNGFRYDARHGIATTKTILAGLFTLVTMSATITFTLMFQRRDRIEELVESSLLG